MIKLVMTGLELRKAFPNKDTDFLEDIRQGKHGEHIGVQEYCTFICHIEPDLFQIVMLVEEDRPRCAPTWNRIQFFHSMFDKYATRTVRSQEHLL